MWLFTLNLLPPSTTFSAWAALAAVISVALQFSEQFIKLECVRFFLFSQLWLFAGKQFISNLGEFPKMIAFSIRMSFSSLFVWCLPLRVLCPLVGNLFEKVI